MELLGAIFNSGLQQPLANLLAGIYVALPYKDLGIAILLFTIIVRFALFPLTVKAMKSQRMLSELQPKIKDVQDRFKNDREAQGREIMALYKAHNINPFMSLLPILLQFPVLIALWRILMTDVSQGGFGVLYGFIPDPGAVSVIAFGFLDLGVSSPVLAVAAGVAQLVQSRLALKDAAKGQGDFGKLLSRQTMFIFPIITVVIAWSFPAALALYWFATTAVSALQHFIAQKMIDKSYAATASKN